MLRLPLLFARRYLFSKKSHSVINIISGVSAFSVAIPVMAMVILLSVFNGLEGMVKEIYRNFDPDVLITPAEGKVFDIGALPADQLRALDEVSEVSYSLEGDVLFEYRAYRHYGTIRGVDSLYREVIPMDTLIVEGQYRLRFGMLEEAVIGQGVAYALGVRTNFYDPLIVYAPTRGSVSPLLPMSYFNRAESFPAGIFALESEIDSKYVITSLDFAQNALDYPGKASQASVRLTEGVDVAQAIRAISEAAGPDFKAKSRYEQNAGFYRIMAYEKWAIFFIILLVMIIASFSLIGSLVMLIIDKQKDMSTLITMGADVLFLRRIFTNEGMLIYAIGASTGLVLGLALALVQQRFGLVRIGAETFLWDAFPVEVRAGDIILVVATSAVLSFIISALTSRTMIPKEKIRIS